MRIKSWIVAPVLFSAIGCGVNSSVKVTNNAINSNANAQTHAFDSNEPPSIKTLVVPANAGWVKTGVEIDNRRKFMIRADGDWSTGKENCPPIGCTTHDQKNIVPEAGSGALIAIVGTEKFFVGDRYIFENGPLAGELLLSINDLPNAFADNKGSVEVTIWYSP